MPDKPDYRDTVFLPRTDFPMKAGLAQKEPAILARWAEEGLYQQQREARAGRERFILHDGPPYANGDIHIGHAMMKTIKDFIIRSQSLLGKDAPFIPGWDCHGLPIEWKIEEQYRKKKIDKELMKFAESGQLYRGAKPVMWSPVEKTALAEAEVEYEDVTSTQIDVGFRIFESPIPDLIDAFALV